MKAIKNWFNSWRPLAFLSGVGIIYLTFPPFWLNNSEAQEKTWQQLAFYEVSQIVQDEGFKRCVYRDTLGNETVGFGHLVQDPETFPECVTSQQAVDLLLVDYIAARESVKERYPWAHGEVKQILINMTFQLGPTGLSRFEKMLAYAEEEQYVYAAVEMLDSRWARQTPNRSQRLAGRMIALGGDK